MTDNLKRVAVWKNLLLNGTDYCALSQTAEGWMLKGAVTGVLRDQRPVLANYEIHSDGNWLTHRVQLDCTIAGEVKSLSLGVESRGMWRSSGQELPALRSCDDVDLALTPATNTLAIRRLKLEVGSSESIIAAWVKFPELTVQPLSERYTRIDQNTYRYASNTGFSAEITVDDLGLVISYPGAWERIGTS
jgi:hypothetical protein